MIWPDLGGAACRLAKAIARRALGQYSIYYIYSCRAGDESVCPSSEFRVKQIDDRSIVAMRDGLIRDQVGYFGTEAHAYACFLGEQIVGVCIYWFGGRYRRRNFWPLREGEAKLVQIVSVPEMRRRGVATTLISSSFRDMVHKGFDCAYARVWHSNMPSLRAFERAGWRRIALIVEINPLHRVNPWRLSLRTGVGLSHRR